MKKWLFYSRYVVSYNHKKNVFFQKHLYVAILLLFSTFFLQSCYVERSYVKGNIHDKLIGMTKSDIILEYGEPKKVINDDNGGEILIYEDIKYITEYNAIDASYQNKNAAGVIVLDRNSAAGFGTSNASSIGKHNAISESYYQKKYLNIAINKNGRVYKYNSNYGQIIGYYRCLNKPRTIIATVIGALSLWAAPIAIPWGIISIVKAKKKGELCD